MSDSEMKPNCFGKFSFDSYTVKEHGCDICDICLDCEDASKQSLSSLNKQVAGDHYKTLKIQPVEYIHANNLDFFEGNIVKYVTRWRTKNGIDDLEKAKHYIELLIELETKG